MMEYRKNPNVVYCVDCINWIWMEQEYGFPAVGYCRERAERTAGCCSCQLAKEGKLDDSFWYWANEALKELGFRQEGGT